VEPKTYKEALTQACWIESMQEELHEFKRLEVWELVPRPDKVMVITLKWIYKVKLDELGGILKNKARLVARGYRQEEGIDFEESARLEAIRIFLAHIKPNKSQGNQPNDNVGIKENLDTCKVGKETVFAQQYVLLPLWSTGSQDLQTTDDDVADAAFDVKENENDVHVFANGSDKTNNQKHDEKAKRDDKGKNPSKYPDDPDMPELEDIVYSDDEEEVGAEANLSNLETNIPVSPIPTTRVHKDHPVNQIIGDLNSAPQIRSMTRMVKEQDLPNGKRAIGSKWVFRNKKDKRGIVIRNKGRLVAQGHTQEEDMDYNEVFALVARIEAIRLFLAYAFFMGFMVYQMDVKSAFLYGTIEKEVYVCQLSGFEDPDYPDKELCKAFEKLMKDKFQMSFMGELTFFLGLQVKQKDDGIFIRQDKYVVEILRKFGFTDVKSASTYIETKKPLPKDPDVKRNFRYLKGKQHLGLWYLRDSPFNLMAYSDSDYAGASLDRKSTTGGCQFLGVNTPRCDEDNLELKELMVSWYQFVEKDGIGVTAVNLMMLGHKLMLSRCLSAKRTAWNEFSCSMASVVICLATGRKFNFYKYIFDSMVRNVDSPSKFLMYPHFLQVVMDHQVDDMTTHNTRYTSPALTQKVFLNMRRVGKGFSGVETPLFDFMLEDAFKQGEKIAAIDADEGITLVDVETDKEVVAMDAESQGRLNQEDVSVAEPTVFDDEDVTMTMAQNLIKLKAEKAKLLDEQLAQKLHDEEVQKAAARDKQEKADMERALELQREYDEKEKNIDWSVVVEQVQERHLDSIRKYQNLKKKPISIAQPRKNMIIYLKNMAGYKIEFFRGMAYDKKRPYCLMELDHTSCLDSCKSASGGIQFLGGDKLVSWSSKKQDCTSMSSVEAEYVSLSACCAQVLWLRTQLTDYGFYFDKIHMYCDLKAARAILYNPVQHSRTKHIDVRYHFIKEQVEKGIVELLFVGTEYQLADLFTKALPKDRFKYLIRRLGMRCLTPEELEVLANESA
nr:ribonuclease H-like domain-containing protein [Tanacetum cinerariifolium]